MVGETFPTDARGALPSQSDVSAMVNRADDMVYVRTELTSQSAARDAAVLMCACMLFAQQQKVKHPETAPDPAVWAEMYERAVDALNAAAESAAAVHWSPNYDSEALI